MKTLFKVLWILLLIFLISWAIRNIYLGFDVHSFSWTFTDAFALIVYSIILFVEVTGK